MPKSFQGLMTIQITQGMIEINGQFDRILNILQT